MSNPETGPSNVHEVEETDIHSKDFGKIKNLDFAQGIADKEVVYRKIEADGTKPEVADAIKSGDIVPGVRGETSKTVAEKVDEEIAHQLGQNKYDAEKEKWGFKEQVNGDKGEAANLARATENLAKEDLEQIEKTRQAIKDSTVEKK